MRPKQLARKEGNKEDREEAHLVRRRDGCPVLLLRVESLDSARVAQRLELVGHHQLHRLELNGGKGVRLGPSGRGVLCLGRIDPQHVLLRECNGRKGERGWGLDRLASGGKGKAEVSFSGLRGRVRSVWKLPSGGRHGTKPGKRGLNSKRFGY